MVYTLLWHSTSCNKKWNGSRSTLFFRIKKIWLLTFERWFARKFFFFIVWGSEAQNLVFRRWTSPTLCLNSVAALQLFVMEFKFEPLINGKFEFLILHFKDWVLFIWILVNILMLTCFKNSSLMIVFTEKE